MLSIDKAEILVDYRISVVTRPGMEDTYYSPHWTSDNRGTFTFTGWQDPQGTGDMLEHGVVTLSMRATKTDSLLWEGGVSKLLRSDESEVNMAEAAKMAANALAKKIPAH
jgi:HSP90 family molecular chaperone